MCLEHVGSFARKKARQRWRECSNGIEPPDTVQEAMTLLGHLSPPLKIKVLVSSKFKEVSVRDYTGNTLGIDQDS
jgi:hypothetical protein